MNDVLEGRAFLVLKGISLLFSFFLHFPGHTKNKILQKFTSEGNLDKRRLSVVNDRQRGSSDVKSLSRE